MAGTVIIPWYATGLRSDDFARALNELAPSALRYGASAYAVFRLQEDLYKFQQMAVFEDHLSWENYWNGPELTKFRVRYSSWYQIPVLYGWWDMIGGGGLEDEPLAMMSAGGPSRNGERD